MTPQRSVNAFNKLVDQNGISSVLTALSSVTLAIKPIANEKHIPLVNANAFSTDIDDADDFCFSILPNAKEYGNYLAKFTYDSLKQHEIGILCTEMMLLGSASPNGLWKHTMVWEDKSLLKKAMNPGKQISGQLSVSLNRTVKSNSFLCHHMEWR